MNICLQIIFLVGFSLNFITTLHGQSAQYSKNELYYSSTGPSPNCDVNCQDLKRRYPLTHIRPVAGCYCKPNYARNLQQKCISRQQCGAVL